MFCIDGPVFCMCGPSFCIVGPGSACGGNAGSVGRLNFPMSPTVIVVINTHVVHTNHGAMRPLGSRRSIGSPAAYTYRLAWPPPKPIGSGAVQRPIDAS